MPGVVILFKYILTSNQFVMKIPFSSTNSKTFNKQTQQLLVTSQRLLLNNLSFIFLLWSQLLCYIETFDWSDYNNL
ncbi:hypothetical protein RI543_003411 [Arxiozyma heterogenica]|uniref:Uncharacterized protein n=1 Tax=Arxiozyma heterogenica TaxID=278026 RepID=A0AAN8A8I7_9SACH|nr:hypothetical protein RI543_003411 [Kazachstania heterogenica]